MLLEQIDQQRAALLRSVSHDLRTPLATIRAVATDLRDDNVHDATTRHELLDSVSHEAERLDRLVGNLLHMSRADAGSLRVEAQAVDMAELVQLTVLRMRRVCTDVTLELQVDPALAADRRRPGAARPGRVEPGGERRSVRTTRLDRLSRAHRDRGAVGDAAAFATTGPACVRSTSTSCSSRSGKSRAVVRAGSAWLSSDPSSRHTVV